MATSPVRKQRVRAPSMKFGDWRLQYRQHQYDDRYFELFNGHRCVWSINQIWFESTPSRLHLRDLLTACVSSNKSSPNFDERLDLFLKKVKAYGLYLDVFGSA